MSHQMDNSSPPHFTGAPNNGAPTTQQYYTQPQAALSPIHHHHHRHHTQQQQQQQQYTSPQPAQYYYHRQQAGGPASQQSHMMPGYHYAGPPPPHHPPTTGPVPTYYGPGIPAEQHADAPWAPGDSRFRSVPVMNAEERERKRRISHSAMERRRRERTNTIINELKGLVPWLRNEARLQKLEVLEQCVCYIKELQAATTESNKRRKFSDEPEPVSKHSPVAGSEIEDDAPKASVSQLPIQVKKEPSTNNICKEDGDEPEYWGSLTDLPDLMTSSGTSSKASSTVSTITPFRGPLPKEIAEHAKRTSAESSVVDGDEGNNVIGEPAVVKNSIDFLTT